MRSRPRASGHRGRCPAACGGLARWLVAVCLAPTGGVVAQPPAVWVDSVLAVVDGTPVLLSDVRLAQTLQGGDRETALQAAIDERLMFQEALRLAQTRLGTDEAAAAVDSLRARLGAQAADWPAAALERLARRQAAVLKYVGFRFAPQVRVSEEELAAEYRRRYGAAHTAPASPPEESPAGESASATPSSPEAAERLAALRAEIESRQLDERIEAWVRELRAAADVRRPHPE